MRLKNTTLKACGSRSVLLLAALTSFFSMAGCLTTPRVVPTASTRDASELERWQANGRIAVSGSTTGGSGSFTWVQRGGDAKVQIHGPIGIGSLQLTLSDRTTHIETGDGQVFDAADAESELAERLGAAVPVKNLRYWLVGVAAPGAHEWQNASETATLTQEAWRIDYQRYAVTNDVRLPTKLIAVSGPAKVRILIDRWRLLP